MFGGQPAVWFCERFPQMWVSEPFNMGYFFYYPMILLVVVWYFLYRFDLFEKVSFVIVTAFFIYYLIYIFVPRCRAAVLLPRHWKRPCGARYLPVHR